MHAYVFLVSAILRQRCDSAAALRHSCILSLHLAVEKNLRQQYLCVENISKQASGSCCSKHTWHFCEGLRPHPYPCCGLRISQPSASTTIHMVFPAGYDFLRSFLCTVLTNKTAGQAGKHQWWAVQCSSRCRGRVGCRSHLLCRPDRLSHAVL